MVVFPDPLFSPDPRHEIENLQAYRHKIYKKYYEPWKKNAPYCPYLECKVFATKSGWEHTAGISKSRSIQDTQRRLELFKYAKEIIEKSGTCQYIRYQNGAINYTFEAAVQFRGEGEKGKKLLRIKVVVIKRKDGVCLYHSVMD